MATVEGTVFKKYHDKMVEAIRPALPGIASTFYSASFIDKKELGKCENGNISDYLRASQLLQSIDGKIIGDPGRFEDFLKILSNDSCNDGLVDQLRQEIRSVRKMSKSYVNPESEVLIKYHFVLVSLIESCVPRVSNQLKQQGLIDEDTERRSKNSSQSNVDRASTIIDHVKRKTQEDLMVFETFTSFLDNFFPLPIGSLMKEEKKIWTEHSKKKKHWYSRSCAMCKLNLQCSALQMDTTEMLKRDIHEKNEQIESQKKTITHMQETVQQLEKREQALKERLKSEEQDSREVMRLKKELAEKENQKEELLKKIEKLEKEGLEKNQEEIKELQLKLASIEKELNEVKLKLARAEHELELAKLKLEHALKEQELELYLKWTREENEKREKERERERQRNDKLMEHLFKTHKN